ncbi:hypothetical protein [Streptomyces sp. ADI95-17]|uniref:hypothetical protein n=1 Tax=Streptomyces sp. ADI95-17 TaxID=1522759 RepID=UPI000F5B9A78|nr:hypothetical protein [Streptomyces sp. ADI95-17]RPK74488.1 hypothetical protein EES42_08460 [Streptomyces sp. ADI95-17]
MPFFVVDDGADSHPKMIRAKNAAVGLWTRVGSYVARQLTDGHVPGEVAKMYGSAPQITKLLTVGLWHEHGHTCPRCPQPRPGDYFMHDYRESGNPSRAEVLARRKRAADKKAKQRAAQAGFGADSAENPSLFGEESSGNHNGFDEETDANPSQDPGDSAGHGDVSLGDSPGTSRARVPLHSTPLLKEGAEEREGSTGSSARAALSLIPANWEPSDADVRAAQLARLDSGREQLTPQQLDVVTRKFVRRQLDDGKTAAAWGGRWRQWAETERPEQPAAGGVVVPFTNGAQPQTKSQQQRAGLAALRERLQGGSSA